MSDETPTTFARQALAAIEAAILGQADPAQKRLRLTTGSGTQREIERFTLAELYEIRARLLTEIAEEDARAYAEQIAGQGGTGIARSIEAGIAAYGSHRTTE